MAFRGAAGRTRSGKVEVWQCSACGNAGASFYAIRPAAHVPAMAPAFASWLGRLLPRPAAARTRATLEQDLSVAEQAIRHCQRYGQRQLAEVERRERLGFDASRARNLLVTFRQVQAAHEAHRARLLAELMATRRSGKQDA